MDVTVKEFVEALWNHLCSEIPKQVRDDLHRKSVKNEGESIHLGFTYKGRLRARLIERAKSKYLHRKSVKNEGESIHLGFTYKSRLRARLIEREKNKYLHRKSVKNEGENLSSSGLTRRSLSLANACCNNKNLLQYAHLRGWVEDQDEVEAESVLVRRSAARILHQFMKIELHISDLNDISAADELKDLYTCRVCVNHVAQVYLRNLMDGEEILQGDEIIKIFNMMKPVSKDEMDEILDKIYNLVKKKGCLISIRQGLSKKLLLRWLRLSKPPHLV